jgi:hypothetical protein
MWHEALLSGLLFLLQEDSITTLCFWKASKTSAKIEMEFLL